DLTVAKAALTLLANNLAALPASKYTAASYANLAAAIALARTVVANAGTLPGHIAAATVALSNAATALAPATQVASPAVVWLKAGQKALTLVKGKSLKLVGKAYTATGSSKVTWTSSKKKVATVSSTGKVTAKKAGKTTIKLKAGNLTASVTVKVVASKPAKAKVTKVTATVPTALRIGATAFVTGTYKPGTATSVKVTYKSSSPSVASIDSAGRLKGLARGTAQITVKAGAKSKTYQVTVS
ncbi:MAG: Ig-like domain-containing protein, partial [Bifidobacteriaceae bacterium]|nr:Ig-like domain-containing protein [Bifidobacteriaceae bacterium]